MVARVVLINGTDAVPLVCLRRSEVTGELCVQAKRWLVGRFNAENDIRCSDGCGFNVIQVGSRLLTSYDLRQRHLYH